MEIPLTLLGISMSASPGLMESEISRPPDMCYTTEPP